MTGSPFLRTTVQGGEPHRLAELFAAIHPRKATELTAPYFAWRYSRAFPGGMRSVCLWKGDDLVGHAGIALVPVRHYETITQAAQLVDLGVLQSARGAAAVRMIYRNARAEIERLGATRRFTVPNEKALALNRHLLGMRTVRSEPVRVLLARPSLRSPTDEDAFAITPERCGDETLGRRVSEHLAGDDEPAFDWSAKTLLARLCDPFGSYHLHFADGWMIATRPAVRCAAPHFVVMGAFARSDASAGGVGRALATAARHHRTPIGLYWGTNPSVLDALEKSRFAKRLRRRFVIQSGGPDDAGRDIRLPTRLELLDVDIQ